MLQSSISILNPYQQGPPLQNNVPASPPRARELNDVSMEQRAWSPLTGDEISETQSPLVIFTILMRCY